jgi:hypothetical protein
MKTLDQFNLLLRMDQFIRLKATGNPKEFAARLRLSQSMMYNYLDVLKSLGGPIRYCKKSGSYEYEFLVRFEVGYKKVDS